MDNLGILVCLLVLFSTISADDQNTITYESVSSSDLADFTAQTQNITEDAPNSLYEIEVPQSLSLEWQNDADTVSVSIRKIPSDTAHLSVTAAILHESQKAALESPATVVVSCSSENSQNKTGNTTRKPESLCEQIEFKVLPLQLGRAKLLLTFEYENRDFNITYKQSKMVDIVVIKVQGKLDKIFNIVLVLMLGTITLTMGSSISLQTVKETMKKPKAPALALLCQFIIMPLLAYGIIWMEGYRGGPALGFFAMGCAPGGGMSNMYSHLLGGDLSISITLTLLSTVICIATIPFWLYTLGTTFPTDGEKAVIPFVVILQAFALLVVPLAIGLLIQYKLQRVAQIMKKCLSVLMILILAFMCTFGIYTNIYIFYLFTVRTMFTSLLLPFGGFFLGGLLAAICRFEWKIIKTVAIETGLQNAAVPFFMIQVALTSPDLELAAIPIVYIAVLTPVPMLTISLCYILYNKIRKRKSSDRDGDLESHSSGTSSSPSFDEHEDKQDMLSPGHQLDEKLITDKRRQSLSSAEDIAGTVLPCYDELVTEGNLLLTTK